MRRLAVLAGRLAALLPESRIQTIIRNNEACLAAIEEGRTEPLPGATGPLCSQGGIPCQGIRCPVLNASLR
jgi:hypothetical protein